jgi:hypothetical protein
MALPPGGAVLGIAFKRGGSPTTLSSSLNTELLSSDISPPVKNFNFPRKASWCVERALFHVGNFPPLSCVVSLLAQNSKHPPVEGDV